MFIFSVFRCVLYLVQCSSDPNASLCSNRHPPPTHTLHFSSKLQQSATIFTAVFPLLGAFPSFCFLLPLCLCSLCVVKEEAGQILGLVVSFQNPLQSSANLSDHFILQSCCRLRPLSQRLDGSNPRSGEVLKGAIEKCQAAGPATELITQGQELPQESTAVACDQPRGGVIPTWVKVSHRGRSEAPDSNHKREEALPGRRGDVGQEGEAVTERL